MVNIELVITFGCCYIDKNSDFTIQPNWVGGYLCGCLTFWLFHFKRNLFLEYGVYIFQNVTFYVVIWGSLLLNLFVFYWPKKKIYSYFQMVKFVIFAIIYNTRSNFWRFINMLMIWRLGLACECCLKCEKNPIQDCVQRISNDIMR